MDRMDYEYLLRAAYNSGRDVVRGINADVFDGLERKEIKYKNALKTSQNIKEATFQFGIKVGEVATQISMAIEHVLRERKDSFSKEQIDELKNCKYVLFELNSDTDVVDKICEIIERVNKVIL